MMTTQKISKETIEIVNNTFKKISKGELIPEFPSFDYKLKYIIKRFNNGTKKNYR